MASAMGMMAAEAGGLQPAGGDKVPLQMTAKYDGDSSSDLRRFTTIGTGRGGGGQWRLLRGCILDVQAICDYRGCGGQRWRRRQFILTTVAHGGKCWWVAVHRGWAAGGGGGGRMQLRRWRPILLSSSSVIVVAELFA